MPPQLPEWFENYRCTCMQRLGEAICTTPLRRRLTGFREPKSDAETAESTGAINWLIVDGVRTNFKMDARTLFMKLTSGRAEIRAVFDTEQANGQVFVTPRVEAFIKRSHLVSEEAETLPYFTGLGNCVLLPGKDQIIIHTGEDLSIQANTFQNCEHRWLAWYQFYAATALEGLCCYFHSRSVDRVG